MGPVPGSLGPIGGGGGGNAILLHKNAAHVAHVAAVGPHNVSSKSVRSHCEA